MKTQMSSTKISCLVSMLAYRRPKRSASEEQFIARYIDTIPGVYSDEYGNRILICEGSRVIISTHTDSVHHDAGKQRVSISSDGIVSLSHRELVSNCLGADDAAGVYAAIRMIEAGVKATFVFHRDEECGGLGSNWLARKYPDWLASHDICLALDRRGTKDIIVSQSWGMSASEEFAHGLASRLNMGHAPADGIFTDSANYVDLIPECSNLSIGYQSEHSIRETLDVHYLESVIERLVTVDWGTLPVARVPGQDYEPTPVSARASSRNVGSHDPFDWIDFRLEDDERDLPDDPLDDWRFNRLAHIFDRAN